MTNNFTIKEGSGIKLIGGNKQEYLDAASGTFNLSLGYHHPEVNEKLKEQLSSFVHLSSHFTGQLSEEIIKALNEFSPKGINDGWFRDLTGSTAVECAVKMTQKYTKKSDIISLFLSHHGQTSFSTSISGNSFRKTSFINSSISNHICVPAPYCYRCHYKHKYPQCNMLCVEAIADHIEYGSSGNTACLIVEPIMGNGGNIVPPKEYFSALRKLCDQYSLQLIIDEVQTGLGRTGYFYASEYFDIEPDVIVLAKGLGGVGIPVGAVLIKEYLNTFESYEHSFTSGCNLLACTAVIETIKVLKKPGFLESVRKNGEKLGAMLMALKDEFTCIGDVRGVGYMWGIEIDDAHGNPDVEKTNVIINNAFEDQRLILRGSRYSMGNVVKIRPALVATMEEVEEIVDKVKKTLQKLN